MSCENFRDDLVAVLYDELEGAELGRLESHLASCPNCRDELEALRADRRALRAAEPEIPAARRVVVVERRSRASALWGFAGGLAAAAMLVLALALTGAWPANAPAHASAAAPSDENAPVTRAELAAFEAAWEEQRREDLQFVLREVVATDARNGLEIDRTQRALQEVALAADPGVQVW